MSIVLETEVAVCSINGNSPTIIDSTRHDRLVKQENFHEIYCLSYSQGGFRPEFIRQWLCFYCLTYALLLETL